MPGHMNVLLAEAQVPYEQLKEMDEIDPSSSKRMWLVVGANDASIPRPRPHPAPAYGMLILHANQARQVVFMKRSMRPASPASRTSPLSRPPHCSSETPRTP
jgi:NAD(P) transhydrogenase subunit beta